jgi:hypothetical protein
MKYMKKIILIILCAAIIGGGYFYFLNKDKVAIQQDEAIDTVPAQAIKNTKEVRVGDMVLDVPEEVDIIKTNRYSLSLEIPGLYADYNRLDGNTRTQVNHNLVMFSFYEDTNLENKSAEGWFISGNSKEPGIIIDIPNDEFSIIVGSFDAYKTVYSSGDFLDTKYYDRHIVYISNKTDIYEVWNYAKPEIRYSKLTKEEQESIDNYEKVVNQIIQSIRFVE